MKLSLVEIIVYRIGQCRSDPTDGTKGVCAGPQMGNGTQVFKRMPLFRHRIGFRIINPANNRHPVSLNFAALTAPLGFNEFARDLYRTTGSQLEYLVLIVAQVTGDNRLYAIETGTIVDI